MTPPSPMRSLHGAAAEVASLRSVPDVIGDDCSVLFCGINPGLLSGTTGHHFARPGNRFWKALALGGLVDRVLDPSEERELIAYGIGITNLVSRVTASAKEVAAVELAEGAELLRVTLERVNPEILAVLGVGAWRAAVNKHAQLGRQAERFGGTTVYVLPNPSGLQARYQLPELAVLFGEVRVARDLARHDRDLREGDGVASLSPAGRESVSRREAK